MHSAGRYTVNQHYTLASTRWSTRSLRELAQHLDAMLLSDNIDETNRIVCLTDYMKKKENSFRAPDTITALTDVIGAKYALLLHLLGYSTIQDLAEAHPVSIATIPGIGEKRLIEIFRILRTHGLICPKWRNFAPTAPEGATQLSFEF